MVFDDNPAGVSPGSGPEFVFVDEPAPAVTSIEEAGEALRDRAGELLGKCMADMIGDMIGGAAQELCHDLSKQFADMGRKA